MQKYFIRKIKEGKISTLKKWCATLQSRKDEVLKSLEVEGVSCEFAFTTNISGDDYFIAYMESIETTIKPADMNLEINKEHVKVLRECLEPLTLGEELYHFRII